VRDRNPELFGRISEQITALRRDPETHHQGRAVRLGDGRTARLTLHYDHIERVELALVWLIERVDGVDTVKVIALEPVD
jgi:hypothetical protein